jgi:DMSO reductase anchor subunit
VLTPYILIAVALVLLLATALRRMRHGAVGPQGRTWLLVAAIFGVVSAWLLVSP